MDCGCKIVEGRLQSEYHHGSPARIEYCPLHASAEKLRDALMFIGNRAGGPTMGYAPDIEREEQRASLDWIADKVRETLAAVKGVNHEQATEEGG